MGDPFKRYDERRQSDTKGRILSDTIYMKCPDVGNPQRQKVDSCQGLEGGKGNRETDNRYRILFGAMRMFSH